MVQSLLNCTRCWITVRPHFPSFRLLLINFYSDSQITPSNAVKASNVDFERNVSNIPEPPTTCCMSGCAKCVWIEYAERLTACCKDGGEKAREQILARVTDANMRAFLMLELRIMNNSSQ